MIDRGDGDVTMGSRYPRCTCNSARTRFAIHAGSDSATALDTARIEQLTGLKGTYPKEENVFMVSKRV